MRGLVTFPCAGSAAAAAARLEAAIDARAWNTPGMDGWIRGGGAVLYYRDAAMYRALFRRTFIGRGGGERQPLRAFGLAQVWRRIVAGVLRR